MKLRPLARHPSAGYPQAGPAVRRDDLVRALPRRWRVQPKVVAALVACLTLSGCGSGPTPQSIRDAVDRAAVALHFKQPPVRLMGMVMSPRVPLPNSTLSPAVPALPSNTASPARGHKP